ncbi:MAG: ABC transporter substrate-binding protein [Reyranella sp.]|nr:ABC transporter substrate-binding protein [Reyranella sp.]MDP3160092.1 ABC transporter substrate-binding protein [Reyranella sp.]
MRRRNLVIMLGGAATAWPVAAHAQQPKKLPRLCFLTFDPGTLQSTRFGAFFEGLRDLGYVQGQSILIDYLTADGQAERYSTLAAECVRLGADVIVTSTTPATLIAKSATQTIPIVMVGLGDPVGTGLVDSLARPGGNVTGLSLMFPSLAVKRLELLREFVPQISRVLVLTHLSDPVAASSVKALEEAAPALGIKLQIQDIRTPDDLPAAFEAGVKERAEGVINTGESIFAVNRTRLAELAARHRLPGVYHLRVIAEAGGLMSYQPVSAVQHRRAATYVDKLLRGAKPADLPIEQPTQFEFIVNLKSAKALGLIVPPALLARADEVIE